MSKGVVFTSHQCAEFIDVESRPSSATTVQGRTIATLVSAGTELAVYTGTAFPVQPGYACVFEVDEVGTDVADVRVGDLAFCMGTHAQRQCIERADVLLLPDGMLPEHAVYARMMGVSMTTLVTTKARPPGPVLVTGLGLVGHL